MAPLNLTGVFLPALMTALLRNRLESFTDTELLDTYDYIIIGSGFGGSVVANRLSENADHKILLLEAGSKDNVSTQVPLLSIALLGGGYDWNYDIVPQKRACFAMNDNNCKLSAGKVIGGSSALDMMINIRGHKEDFDKWEKNGNQGWSFDDVLPFFKKTEDFRVNGECVQSEYHNCDGELVIGPLPEGGEGAETEYFIEGAKEMGFDEIDYNGPTQIGVSRCQFSMRQGIRESAATVFLRPVMSRPNLHISLDSFVRKIIIDPETKTAIGVEFEKDGKIIEVTATKEVILSAGIYSSPKILMLSGIGPKEELDKFKIPVISNAPGVGQNLMERIGPLIIFTTGKTLSEERQNVVSTTTIRQWNTGTGLMASASGIDAALFLKTKYAEKDSEAADLFILFQSLPMYSITEPFVLKGIGYSSTFWEKNIANYLDKEIVMFHPVLLRPKSKGFLTIRSSDPHDDPIIDPNYFSEEIDKKILIEGYRIAEKFINTTLFRKAGFHSVSLLSEECDKYGDKDSDEHIECLLQYMTITKWIGCCTNKMGPDTNPLSVVDHRLRVHGVKKLRIVDASIIPEIHSGTPSTAVIMIGEKAAQMIKEDNQ